MANLPAISTDTSNCNDNDNVNAEDEVTTDYTEFPKIFENVRRDNLKRRYINATQPSDLESHLLQLFREEEAKDIPDFTGGKDNTKPSANDDGSTNTEEEKSKPELDSRPRETIEKNITNDEKSEQKANKINKSLFQRLKDFLKGIFN